MLNKYSDLAKRLEEIEYLWEEEKVNKENISNIRFYEMRSQNTVIEDLKLLNENNKYVELKNESRKPFLVFRFTEYNCNECIMSQLNVINRYIGKWGKDKVIFIATYMNNRNLFIFKTHYNVEVEMYNLKEQLPLPIEDLNAPYYFILDQNRVFNVFVPLKEDESTTIEYLNMIDCKYFAR